MDEGLGRGAPLEWAYANFAQRYRPRGAGGALEWAYANFATSQRPRGGRARWNGRTLTLHNANGREGRGARWNGRTQTLQRPNGRGAGGRAGMGVRKLCTALVCTPSGSLSWRNAADVLARSLPRRHMSCPLVSATFRMRSPSDGWSRTTTLAAILAAVLHVVPAGRG